MEVSFLDNQLQPTAGLFETESHQSDVVQSSLDHSRVNEDWTGLDFKTLVVTAA